MQKKISEWRIVIPATSDRTTEEDFMHSFLDHFNGKETAVNFHANLIGYCEEWNDVIQTSNIVTFKGDSKQAFFTTRSGSVYAASMADFQGFSCITVRGERKILPI